MTPAPLDAASDPGAPSELPSSSRIWRRGVWIGVIGALLGAVFLILRYQLAITPPLAETYYDEALTGLMALAILHGAPQVFYWGEPYGGAIGDAYPAAIGFWLFGPSTLVLRMAAAVIAVVWAWSLWFVAHRVGAKRFALLAGVLVAVPPIFLSHAQLSTHGESSAMAFATVALASAVFLVEPHSTGGSAWAWALLGIAAGLSWWSSQIGAVLLLASALVLLVARPTVLRGPGPYAAAALFFAASWPFWTWNASHDWATFRHLGTWGGPMPPWSVRPRIVVMTLVDSLRDVFWDNRAVELPRWADILGWVVVWGVYVPGVLVAVARVVTWVQRLLRRERPWQDPLDVVAVAFWGTVAAHFLTWFGTSTVLRYEITFQGILPVLCALALARLAGAGWTPVAYALAAAILGFNVMTHVAFVRDGAAAPRRPVDVAIARLAARGIRYCYADTRVAQVIAFESGERVLCTDFVGFRNYAFLEAVDRVDDPASVAIVTHTGLRRPHPDVMAATLDLAGVRYQRDDVGEFTIFHHFVPPGPARPIEPAGWTIRASTGDETTAFAVDRRVWTRWSAPQKPGAWFEVDLGRAHPVVQVSLLAAPWSADAPEGLRVETSLDGATWQPVGSADDLFTGMHWWKRHPRFDDTGRVTVRMGPQPTRYLRLTQTGTGDPDALWSIAEFFVYEAATTPWEPPPAAVQAETAAIRHLDHWMDDPVGPNPIRAPVTYWHRRAQVPWESAFADATRAVALAPQWEDAHNRYGQALARWGWSETFDLDVERAAQDRAWEEVVRWAEAADAVPEGVWRRGRLVWWALALDQLGRADDGAAIRRRPAPVPETRTKIRFGEALDLVGVDIPREIRPDEAVTLRYHWQLAQPLRYNYWVFLHIRGLHTLPSQDQPIGSWDFGTSEWYPGEAVRQSVVFRLPPDTPAGQYALHVGVWLPWTGKQLHAVTDLPVVRRAVVIGSLTVKR
jgi:F5/8 type C domain/Dolichyl-phosphate-mannose-protein mannosyltransferase